MAFYIVIDFKTWYKNAPECSEDPANLIHPTLVFFQSDGEEFSSSMCS